MGYLDVRGLDNAEQVARRLETIAEGPPGHRVFLRELAHRLRLVSGGELPVHCLFLDGWLMGQHPGEEPNAE